MGTNLRDVFEEYKDIHYSPIGDLVRDTIWLEENIRSNKKHLVPVDTIDDLYLLMLSRSSDVCDGAWEAFGAVCEIVGVENPHAGSEGAV